MIFACMYAPDFAVQAALRHGLPMPDSVAAAIVDGPESLLKVVACNGAARAAGLQIGMTKAQAGGFPGVVLKKRSTQQEQGAQMALLDCGLSFSPRVESTSGGTVTLDLMGLERLLGSPAEMGRQIAYRAEACGLSVNVALAANPDTALCAARGFPGTTVVSPGKEADHLACLPVEVLQPKADTLDTLDSWGVRDLRSLAGLPAIALTQRLGQYGLHLQRLAQGKVQRELVPFDAPTFRESMELEESLELLEPLFFLLNRLLEQLTARLLARSLATDHIQLDLDLEIHCDRQLNAMAGSPPVSPLYQRSLKLPVPSQDSKILLKLLQLELAAHPPQSPVKRMTIEAFPARIRTAQTGLFQPLSPEPAKLEVTMARLRAVVGESDAQGRGRVGFPATVDSHRPDSFAVMPFQERATAEAETPLRTSSLRLSFRWFRPVVGAKVELSNGRPTTMTFQHKEVEIRQAWGPWRISGHWWDQAARWQRDEWDVEISVEGGMALYKIVREDRSGQWFVEGMYD
jgi:protein ImuB